MSPTQQIYSVLTVNIWKSYMWTVVVQNELENDLHSNEHYLSSNDKKSWNKFRPVQDLNPWPLQYQCSTLPTELTSQLGTGHFVAMYLFSDRSHLMSRYCYSKNKNKNMFLPHMDACYDLLILCRDPGQHRIHLQYIILYRKNPQISCTFFPKVIARNWGCCLSAGKFEKGVLNVDANVCHIWSNAWVTKLWMFHSHFCCNSKIYGKTVLNEEIPVNKYQKKINHMSKLVETMSIILKC